MTWQMLAAPLPYREPDRLVMVTSGQPGRGIGLLTPEQALLLRARVESLSDIAVIGLWSGTSGAVIDLVGPAGPGSFRGVVATPNVFALLGVNASIGRTFTEDTCTDSPLLISHAVWERLFARDAAVVGSVVSMGLGTYERRLAPATIVGVLPREVQLTYPSETEVWACAPWSVIERATPTALIYYAIGRLAPGITAEQAQAEVDRLSASMSRGTARHLARPLQVRPLHEYSLGRLRRPIGLLATAVGLLFLLAVANVTSLTLARLAESLPELIIRRALGASDVQLQRLVILEPLILVVVAAISSTVLTAGILPLLRSVMPASFARGDLLAASTSLYIFAAVMLLALAGTILFFLCVATNRALRFGTPHVALNARFGLAAGQIGSAFVLLVMSGLLLQTVWNLQRVDMGFSTSNVLAVEIRLRDARYRAEGAIASFQEAMRRRLATMSSLQGFSLTSSIPFQGTDLTRVFERADTLSKPFVANFRAVDPAFFAVLGIQVHLGDPARLDVELPDTEPAVVSQAVVRSQFGDANPIGKVLLLADRRLEIVGVVGDLQFVRLDLPATPAVYVSRRRERSNLMSLIVRTSDEAGAFRAAFSEAVRSIEPAQPIGSVERLETLVARSISDRGFFASATSTFATVGLILILAGLYGTVHQAVVSKRRELGIHSSLGAGPVRLAVQATKPAAWALGLGIVSGAGLSVFATTILDAQLFGVARIDGWSYGVAATFLLIVGAIACVSPTIAVVTVDPSRMLRHRD